MTLPFDARRLPPPLPTAFLDPEVPQATGEDLGRARLHPRVRGRPGDARATRRPAIGPVPEVGVGARRR